MSALNRLLSIASIATGVDGLPEAREMHSESINDLLGADPQSLGAEVSNEKDIGSEKTTTPGGNES